MMFTRWAHIDRPTWRATKHSLLFSYIFFCCVWMPRVSTRITNKWHGHEGRVGKALTKVSIVCTQNIHNEKGGEVEKEFDCPCLTHWRLFLSLYCMYAVELLTVSANDLYGTFRPNQSILRVSWVVRSSIEMVGMIIDHVPVDCRSYKVAKKKKQKIEITSHIIQSQNKITLEWRSMLKLF
jgi:hypothetical protein